MENKDQFAIDLLGVESVDDINRKFYGRYNFPWAPSYFQSFPASPFIDLLDQDLGYFDQSRMIKKPRIWVAGCGRNQAIYVASRYPSAEVTGTDVAITSLKLCQRYASQLGITNLKLEEQSLNSVSYHQEFDYIICTGVIHHNASPVSTLKKLSAALKPDGIMELMVYNYYHRLFTTAIQKAIRILSRNPLDFEHQYKMIKKLMGGMPFQGLMYDYLSNFWDRTEAEFADSLLQPVEYSYTIETLGDLINDANLEYLHYCMNEFDVAEQNTSWDIDFMENELSGDYNSLSDPRRWQVMNLLKLTESPRLWFYLQRKDSGFMRKEQMQICDEFLATKFRKLQTSTIYHFQDSNGDYGQTNTTMPYPSPEAPTHPLANSVFSKISPGVTMKEIFSYSKIKPTFYNVNTIRNQLCTVASPYLLAAHK